ncbi:hypothetical protein FRC15_006559 [Serendipita sp. 397]|nr:hypothetical protein FRC15_006559 [Serendipita sp. 397]KAG8806263.1 hypothetical protein FRC18_006220 [Serendipita sp. 400]
MEYYTDQAVIVQHLVQNPSPSSNLTTLIFSYIYPDRGNVIDVLLDNPSVFSSLRCLVFPNLDTNRPFWGRIQDGFPKLVALVIGHSRGIDDGHYTLQSLETLEMDSWFNFQLSCPALKHLSIRGYTSGVMDKFMRIHGHQLESLLLGDQGSPLLARGAQKFWYTFPNLELLGIYFRARNIRGPHLEHPLRHLRLFPFGESISPDDVLSMIELFRTVTHIYLAVQDLVQVGDIPRPADELRDRCRERGVEIVELRE